MAKNDKQKPKLNSFTTTIILGIVGLIAFSLFSANGNAEPENSLGEQAAISDEIMETNGVKHLIDLDKVVDGGPGKDGVESIDEPKFVSINKANEFLDEDNSGIGLQLNGESRFYPYKILVQHQIVNDFIGQTPIVITYCPLSGVSVVFERTIDDEVVEFGTSGKLLRSNMLMYNRNDDVTNQSLWSQMAGEAVVGVHTGTKLRIVSSNTYKYSDWKEKYPEGKVLSIDTGFDKDYETDPYSDYYENNTIGFGASFSDDRLGQKEKIIGIKVENIKKAYDLEFLQVGQITDEVGESKITITKNEIGEISISDTDGNPIQFVSSFWFAWLTTYPETELHQ
jgi:hypothetical protein